MNKKPKTINKLLIANRGEIASRIIRTCRKMGITSIAVYSDADRDSLYVKEADKAIHIGASSPKESYLNQDKLIQIALDYGVDALHPGYGFLSENADFAKRCLNEGIIFIGPNAEAIDSMGSKSKAKEIMHDNGVPVIPGYQGADQSIDRLRSEAQKIGYPILIKASAGGGGKGMRIVRAEKELESNIAAAKREANSAFGNDEIILERYISKGRHIEFQIFGDQHGNVIHMLERECTIQRRYQKVIEESPSPVLDQNLRDTMGQAAVNAAKAINYDNAGTVEFIFDERTNEFYFLEVNTRLQVEHPVTEEITGLDLVELQIQVAEGRALPLHQTDIISKGYAVEARLYAEDPMNDFLPSTGKVIYWEVPEVDGLRIDTSIRSRSEVSFHYDPMLAKIIVWGKDRQSAHRKMIYTLSHLKCMGLTTNQEFLLHLFRQKEVQVGTYSTDYIQTHFVVDSLTGTKQEHLDLSIIAVVLQEWHEKENKRSLLKALPSGWRNNPCMPQFKSYQFEEQDLNVSYTVWEDRTIKIELNERHYEATPDHIDGNHLAFVVESVLYKASITKDADQINVHMPESGIITLLRNSRFPDKKTKKVEGGYETPMPAQVMKVLVEVGQEVKAGEPLVILSSMKMENTVFTDRDGSVSEIYVEEGMNVDAGFLLVKVD